MPVKIGNYTGNVNGYLTGCTTFPVRSFYRTMDLPGILERIEARLKVKNLSADAASKLAGKPDAIRNIKRAIKTGKRQGVSTATIRALAVTLECSPAWLLGEEDVSQEGFYRPPPEILGRRDLKVFSAVEGGPGEISWGEEPIEVVPRPWYVANAPEAFALHVTGESMLPVIRPGQIVVVNPALAPVPNELAVYIHDRNGEFKATLKEHRKSAAQNWHVFQYNPPEGQSHEFTLAKAEWPKAQRVVGWFAGR